MIDSICKLQRNEKNFAQKESNDFFRGVCESLRYGLMSYACEQEIREVLMLRAIQKIGDNHTKAHTVSELNPEASDEQHRIHDATAPYSSGPC